MPFTPLPRTAGNGKYPAALVTPVWTAADAVNGNSFRWTGRETVLMRNTHASNTYTVAVDTVADSRNRQGDIAATNIAAGAVKVLCPLGPDGWRQTDGTVHLTANNAAIEFCILDPA